MLVVFWGVASISPAEHKEDSSAKQKERDLATQVKTLGEEVRRLGARVSELEKQRSPLWTTMEQPPCPEASEQPLSPVRTEPPASIQQRPPREPLPGNGDAGLLPARLSSDHDTGISLLPCDPLGDPLQWNDHAHFFHSVPPVDSPQRYGRKLLLFYNHPLFYRHTSLSWTVETMVIRLTKTRRVATL